jgi:hypothetical protein
LAKVGIEIVALIVLPLEGLILHPVLSKLHGVDLRLAKQGQAQQSS